MPTTTSNTSGKRLKTRSGFWILLVAAIVLEGISCVQYFTSYAAIQEEAMQRAQAELRRAELEIEKPTIEMEAAAKTLAMLAEKHLTSPDSMFLLTESVVDMIHPTSIAIAFVPDYYPEKGRLYEICSSRISEDSVYTRQIASKDHDYTELEWFQNGLKIDSCWWCEPYLDNSGSKTYVVSCSLPVHDASGRVVAVVCVDLSLDYLQSLSDNLRLYEGSFFTIHSANEQVAILPGQDTIPGKTYYTFREDIAATGWHLAVVIPDEVLFRDLRRVGIFVIVLMILGLLLLAFILVRAARNIQSLVTVNAQKERIESELHIARAIQMAMLPTRFPPFPEIPNLSAHGVVLPAKEVGGDLFDFYIHDQRLYFCIGDVSGKGVPASLVMAMTRSLFRSFTSYIDNPAHVVAQMNNSLGGEGNTMNMFVTLFLGILDMQTGELRYCNAGHDAPLLLKNSASEATHCEALPCIPNLPLGVLPDFEYQEQEAHMDPSDTLFLYTDGLNEAENIRHEQFGIERIIERLTSEAQMMPAAMIADMQAAVNAFVGEAEQSDDLTMFAIRLISQSPVTTHQTPLAGGHFALVMRNDIQQIPTLPEWLDTIGIPDELNMPINLALEEAVSNVMLYAYPGRNDGKVLVECLVTPKALTFTISDSGIPFDPTARAEADTTLSAEERPIGGLGIHLVRQIMDEVRYCRKNDKNVLTLIKKI